MKHALTGVFSGLAALMLNGSIQKSMDEKYVCMCMYLITVMGTTQIASCCNAL